jgi:hypothetical protein
MAFLDDFTGSDLAPLEGRPGWTLVDGEASGANINAVNSLRANSNQTVGSYKCTSQGSADHYTQASQLSNVAAFSVAVRLTNGNNFIAARSFSGVWEIYKRVSGTLTLIGSFTQALVSGDVVRLTAVGNTITLKVNGTQVISATESFNNTEVGQGLIPRGGSTTAWIDNFEAGAVSVAATATTLTGPTSGTNGVASTNFTSGANGTITGTVTVTPNDGGQGGTFTPTTVAISSGTPTATFTYTPASTGVKTISTTNNGGLTPASSIAYTSNAAGDTTAPVLSAPTGTQTGQTTATLGVSTANDANGTLYAVVTTSATPPSVAAIQAGTGATWAGSQAISSTGAKSFSATGLTASTVYYAHFQHKDAAANESAVATSASFTTAAVASGTITTPVMKNNTGTILASEAGVVVNVYNSTTGALVVRKTGLTSSAGGVVTVNDAAIVAGTAYSYEVVLAANGRRLPVATAA